MNVVKSAKGGYQHRPTFHSSIMERISISIFSFYILYSYCVPVSAFPKSATESFIIHYLEDRRIIPVRVELNTKQKTEHVSSISGESLYDFNERKVAYKDVNSSQCFIADIVEESLEGDRRRLKNLQNGVVRGFYLPTLTIQEEINKEEDLPGNIGILLTRFCKGNTVSLVVRQKHRTRRDTSGDKGQFTHHSYGHYGHQSNNYAHYGHETYVTGTVDKDGQIRDHRATQHQVRSEGSQAYPRPVSRNGPQVFTRDSQMAVSSPLSETRYQTPPQQQSFSDNGRSLGSRGSGQFSLQSTHEGGYQLNLPLGLQAGNKYQGGVRSSGHYGVGGTRPQITTEYQKYPHTVHSATYPAPDQTYLEQTPYATASGHRGIDASNLGQIIPHTPGTGVQKVPTHTRPGIYAPDGSTVTSDHSIRRLIPTRTGFPESQPTALHPGSSVSYPGLHIPTHQPGISLPSAQMPGIIQSPFGVPGQISTGIPGSQTIGPSSHTGQGISSPGFPTLTYQPGISVPSVQTPGRTATSPSGVPGQVSTRTSGIQTHYQPGISTPSGQRPGSIQSPFGVPEQISAGTTGTQTIDSGLYPGSSILAPGLHTPSYQPGISMPSVQLPGRRIQTPGQITATQPGSQTTGLQPVTGISRPSHLMPSIHPDLHYQGTGTQPISQVPNGIIPDQQHLQMPSRRYPTRHDTHRGMQTSPQGVPAIPSPGYESSIGTDKPGITRISPSMPGYTTAGLPQTRPGFEQTFENGVRYPDGFYPQTRTSTGEEYRRGDSSHHVPGIPGYGTPITDTRFPDSQFLQRGSGPIPPEGMDLHGLGASSRGLASEAAQTSTGGSRIFSQDSASSQTQIQTGSERTAAEASAAGQYRGLGSQTQVQGGYIGNGSFSAQAQSGFTGGVVQSQVQGSKQGGLSGSSAHVEQVGSAQSQVQVGQPSGSASSTAQGRFTGGITQVQAQSSKSGGSAGAQSHSTGLSSSQVQVNIGGGDVSEQEHFQGTVSASVRGGHSAGQSQTQLQGGYDAGRTYVATAQGGFDTSLGFQASSPQVGELTSLSNQTVFGSQLPGLGSDFRTPVSSGIPDPGTSHPSPGLEPHLQPGQAMQPEFQRPSTTYPSPGLGPQLQPGLPMQPGLQRPSTRYLSPGLGPQSQPGLPMQPGLQSPSIRYPSPGLGPQLQPGLPMQPGLQRPSTTYPSPDLGPHLQPGLPMQPGLQRPSITYPSPGLGPQSQPGLPMQPGLQSPSIRYPSPGLGPQLQPGLPMQPGLQRHSTTYPSPGLGPQLQPGLPMQPGLQRPSTTYPSPGLGPQLQPGLQRPSTTYPSPGLGPQLHPGLQMQPGLQRPSTTYPSSGLGSQLQPGQPMQPGLQRPSTIYPSHGLGPQLQPGLPMQPGFQRPSFQSGSQPGHPQQPSLFPGQPQISSPVLTRPDGSQYGGFEPSIPEPPSAPGQLPSRVHQPQVPAAVQVTTPPSLKPSITSDTTHGAPGVSEPERSCCEALRDLKRRCCGKESAQDRTSSCCQSGQDDLFDFSSDNDFDENKEPCKVVKAICYIVYKPVGKARVCKPTTSNAC